MGRENWKPGNMIFPLPAVLVSCGDNRENYNLITVAWTGTICTNPPMCYISLRKSRHSYSLIKDTGEFVINLTTASMAKVTDWCGVRSGRDYDKFKECHLDPLKAKMVKAPLVAQSPVCIECRVTEIKELGSHDMFLAEVINVNIDNTYLNSETGALELEKAGLITSSHGKYCELKKPIGHFGYSIKKKKKKKRKGKK